MCFWQRDKQWEVNATTTHLTERSSPRGTLWSGTLLHPVHKDALLLTYESKAQRETKMVYGSKNV